jgi:hypothetical protein
MQRMPRSQARPTTSPRTEEQDPLLALFELGQPRFRPGILRIWPTWLPYPHARLPRLREVLRAVNRAGKNRPSF